MAASSFALLQRKKTNAIFNRAGQVPAHFLKEIDMTTSNPIEKRAKRFDNLLSDYGDGDASETCLIDLLTDARHWCDRYGLDFGKYDRLAYDHYLCEIAEEDAEPS